MSNDTVTDSEDKLVEERSKEKICKEKLLQESKTQIEVAKNKYPEQENPIEHMDNNEHKRNEDLKDDENSVTSKQSKVEEEQDEKLKEQFKDKVLFEELLSSAGEFGLYQVLLLIATCPFFMFGVYSYYSQIFITEVSSNHWCWIPELQHLTYEERRELAIPSDDSFYGYSRCFSYVANWTEVLETGQKPGETWPVESCQNGWEFDQSEIPYPTIGSEDEWVCDKSSYQATAQSLFSVGSIFGCLLFGWMSDKYGRIPAAVAANMFGLIGGVASSFTNNFIQFTICRFIMGMAYDSNMVIIYVLVLEYVAPKYRSIMINVAFAVFYTLFVTTLPFMALALGHWQWIALATSVPFALAIFTPLVIPESPLWLLSKGRVDDAVEKVIKIGKVNKKQVTPELVEKFKWTMQTSPEEQNLSILSVFKRPILRKVILLVCVLYMSVIMVFDGLLRNIGALDFDYFISFALISVTELPSMLLLAFVLDLLGRRWLTLLVMSVSCVFSFLPIFAQTGAQSVAFVMVARFGVNMSYGAVIQWAAEVLPTGVRSSGVSFVHISGFIALAISPYIGILGDITYWLPFTVIGVIAFVGAVIPLFLPETAKKEMPHTFAEAEDLMRNQQFCEMPWKKQIEKDVDTEVYVNESFGID